MPHIGTYHQYTKNWIPVWYIYLSIETLGLPKTVDLLIHASVKKKSLSEDPAQLYAACTVYPVYIYTVYKQKYTKSHHYQYMYICFILSIIIIIINIIIIIIVALTII